MKIQRVKGQKALRRASVITLLTDFGSQDAYIGIMKGVVAGINPSATVIDICHDIPPQDVFGGAYLLSTAYHYFPKGTIHVAVVDPGVGSKRDIVCVEFQDCFFITPNNGLLSFVIQQESPRRIVRATNTRYFLQSPSNTFHGRDIFAPLAAYMSLGVKLHRLGNKIDRLERLNISAPAQEKSDQLVGEVLYIDRFGNLITNITSSHLLQYSFNLTPSAPILSQHGRTKNGLTTTVAIETIIGKEKIVGLCAAYMDVGKGRPLAIIGSTGYLEISINQGNAQKYFKAKRESKVTVRIIALTI
ncbi:MAG: SAM-dependent chlorinase/fluorinase [Planctomycetota bacterium]